MIQVIALLLDRGDLMSFKTPLGLDATFNPSGTMCFAIVVMGRHSMGRHSVFLKNWKHSVKHLVIG